MTIEEKIRQLKALADSGDELYADYEECGLQGTRGARRTKSLIEERRQEIEWFSILKKAKFEYDEAWRIITHPTPDVTYADRDRAQTILDTFRDSLGRLE